MSSCQDGAGPGGPGWKEERRKGGKEERRKGEKEKRRKGEKEKENRVMQPPRITGCQTSFTHPCSLLHAPCHFSRPEMAKLIHLDLHMGI